jgi:NADH-quinone oxidoreductase subunit L
MEQLLYLIPLLPFLGFAIIGLFGKSLSKTIVGTLGTTLVFVPFIISVMLFMNLGHEHTEFYQNVFSWIKFNGININFSFLVDPLSVMMMMIITGIGTLIHIYSMGYMHDDEGFYKFFAYLNLFIFSMLLLVMGANYIVMFFGWEGVGLCSYLLIGFWYKNKDYGKAARKAFIMNRIGDLGLLIGIFIIWNQYGSFEYKEVFKIASTGSGSTALTIATFCLFIGAMGKSAQIPLYTWLPDAMAGPTPVSALIHAATMVTAGIYMIVRSNVLYNLCPDTLHFVALVGIATSLFAAIIGLRQNDIKKVLAYSTVSQLGLMFLALGVGAYTGAMFHLMTHAFFKALLFLGAGSVIHAMSGEQDIRRMGGLKDKIKITHAVFLIGTLAIAGFPLLSGFFSKDEILASVFEHSPILWTLAIISSMITGIYMFRLYFVTFWGKFRGTHEQEHHLHESPSNMTIPLMVLAFLSVVGGFLNLPHLMGEGASQKLANFLHPAFKYSTISHMGLDYTTELILMAVTTLGVLTVIFLCHKFYTQESNLPKEDHEVVGLEKTIAHKFYIDEIYDKVFVNPIAWCGRMFHSVLENKVIDGFVNGVGQAVNYGSNVFKYLQNGNIEYYVLGMTIGIIFIFILKLIL